MVTDSDLTWSSNALSCWWIFPTISKTSVEFEFLSCGGCCPPDKDPDKPMELEETSSFLVEESVKKFAKIPSHDGLDCFCFKSVDGSTAVQVFHYSLDFCFQF